MLENYTKEELLEYVRKPSLLKKAANDIFHSALQSQTIKSR